MEKGEWQNFFKGKRVTQLGLGLLGRGLNDALFLAKHGAILTVTDKKTAEQLASSLEKLKAYEGKIKYVLGEHRLEDFRDCDFVLKAAGVPLDSPEIAEARAHDIPIEMDASLFVKLIRNEFNPERSRGTKLAPRDITIIGITGTRGKSTTTHLIYHILKHALQQGSGQAQKRVFLGGNVKDMATLPLLEEVKAGDFVVLELDSWQLQGFGEARISPHVSVFTTFMDDHLTYYGGDRDLYFNDKANIFKYQTCNDVLIVGEQALLRVAEGKPPVAYTVARAADVPKDWKIQLVGEHNRANIACAMQAARALEIDESIIQKATESFTGVSGRLELIREVKGIKIYNDTTATTPHACAAGLNALDPEGKKNIVLICGGSDKGIDITVMLEAIGKHTKEIILLPGSGSEKLKAKSYKLQASLRDVTSMPEAVQKAFEFADSDDIIILSPGFASFGLFKNEYDRGEQFDKEVKNL